MIRTPRDGWAHRSPRLLTFPQASAFFGRPVALAVIGLLPVAGAGVALWSSLSERDIAEDVRDALVLDAKDAGEFAERYSEDRRHPGEEIAYGAHLEPLRSQNRVLGRDAVLKLHELALGELGGKDAKSPRTYSLAN